MLAVDFHSSFFKLFFKRTPSFDENFKRFSQSDEVGTNFNRIRCPLCKWQPNAESRWFCVSGGFPEFYFGGCGTSWNTFDTRGVCPNCKHKWRFTSCFRCHGFSLHENWYENRDE